MPGAVDAGTIKVGIVPVLGMSPFARDVTVVMFSRVAVLLNHVIGVPPKATERAEVAAKLLPVMAVNEPALRAVGLMLIVGWTVNVVETDAVPAVTVIV